MTGRDPRDIAATPLKVRGMTPKERRRLNSALHTLPCTKCNTVGSLKVHDQDLRCDQCTTLFPLTEVTDAWRKNPVAQGATPDRPSRKPAEEN